MMRNFTNFKKERRIGANNALLSLGLTQTKQLIVPKPNKNLVTYRFQVWEPNKKATRSQPFSLTYKGAMCKF